MALIDGTVVNVALPQIQAQLNATAVDAQWIVESYALFLAALILVVGFRTAMFVARGSWSKARDEP
jgi:MFS family permease